MQEIYQNFKKLYDQEKIQLTNKYLNDIFKHFSIDLILDEEKLSLNFNNITIDDSSKNTLFVNNYSDLNHCSTEFYIICFQYKISIIPTSLIDSFLNYFQKHKRLKIYCFTQNVQQQLQHKNIQEMKIINISDDKNFHEEVKAFILEFRLCFKNYKYNKKGQILYFWDAISKPITSFIIKKSHLENKYYDRVENFYELFYQNIEEEIIEPNEFIKLRQIGQGISSMVYLIYHIKKEKLLALKLIYNKKEEDKLFERERENLMSIKHPLIPRYYGQTKIQSQKGLIIDYFQGESLSQIKPEQTTDVQKMRILLQIIIIIDYIHYYGFIYRELKPSSFILRSKTT